MTINGNVITPSDGKWLYNGEICSDLVYLGKNASASDWQEVDHYIEQGEQPTAYTAEQLAEMTNAELEAICAELGINPNKNKANMITLIMDKQNNT